MQIVVLCNDSLKEELAGNISEAARIVWITDATQFYNHPQADAFMDLQFTPDAQRMELLKKLLPKPVVIGSVVATLAETDTAFIRINNWPTFLKAHAVEGSCVHEDLKKLAESILQCFNKKIEWLPDVAGFVTPRIISTIVNEAYFALAEKVSTKEEINIALKLGTAYPYGPFEWSEKIGLHNIAALLHKLSAEQKRYTPNPLLLQQAAI